ncbi:MAG TPA: phage holin family protein [Flavobacteriaceae bacterium]|nr:phage holin family protein [Flavobacteriaceae bacterium]
MKLILQLIITAGVVLGLSYILSGIVIEDGKFTTALIVALVLGILNLIVKPILVFLTLPATLITFGLFLLVINAVIVLLAEYFVPGFMVENFWWALLFSLLLTLCQSILYSLLEKK